jgi:hypothetical protein
LASIDAITSVALAPMRLTAIRTGAPSKPGDNHRPQRGIRVTRLEDRVRLADYDHDNIEMADNVDHGKNAGLELDSEAASCRFVVGDETPPPE